MKTASFFTYAGPGRISIARYAPRGTPAGFKQYKKLAPGSWFNSVPKEEYIRLFRAEILGPLDPKQVLDELQQMALGNEPHLLCWEVPPFDEVKNWCHRRMVAEWFGEKLGIDVPELDAPRLPKPGGGHGGGGGGSAPGGGGSRRSRPRPSDALSAAGVIMPTNLDAAMHGLDLSEGCASLRRGEGVPVIGSRGDHYLVGNVEGQILCTCMGFAIRSRCYHAGAFVAVA